jgi:hypothetical protein
MVQFNYNMSEVKPNTNVDPLPANWYIAQITDTQTRTPKSGQGSMLNVTFEIIDGEHRGRKVWNNYCHEHPSAQTQAIARQNLAAICHACGMPNCGASEQLHYIPLKIKLRLKRDKNTDELVNEIAGYAQIERTTANKAAQPAQTASNTDTPPWMSKQ